MLLPKHGYVYAQRLGSPSLLTNPYYARIYVVAEDVGIHTFPKPKNIIENKVIDIDACNSLFPSKHYTYKYVYADAGPC